MGFSNQLEIRLQHFGPDGELTASLVQGFKSALAVNLHLSQAGTDLFARQLAIRGQVEQPLLTNLELLELPTGILVHVAHGALFVGQSPFDK